MTDTVRSQPRTNPITSSRRAAGRGALARAGIALVAAAPLVGGPAAAVAAPPGHPAPDRVTRSSTTDPNDTRGPLDLARVTHRIAVFGKKHVHVAYTLRTFTRFRTRDLNRRHRHFTIELATDGTPGASRNIAIYARNGRLRADLISNATRKRIARLPIRRIGPTRVRVRGPRRLTGARRYFVTATYEKRSTAPCGRVGNIPITCGDDVPQRGWLRMDRPAWPRSAD